MGTSRSSSRSRDDCAYPNFSLSNFILGNDALPDLQRFSKRCMNNYSAPVWDARSLHNHDGLLDAERIVEGVGWPWSNSLSFYFIQLHYRFPVTFQRCGTIEGAGYGWCCDSSVCLVLARGSSWGDPVSRSIQIDSLTFHVSLLGRRVRLPVSKAGLLSKCFRRFANIGGTGFAP